MSSISILEFLPASRPVTIAKSRTSRCYPMAYAPQVLAEHDVPREKGAEIAYCGNTIRLTMPAVFFEGTDTNDLITGHQGHTARAEWLLWTWILEDEATRWFVYWWTAVGSGMHSMGGSGLGIRMASEVDCVV